MNALIGELIATTGKDTKKPAKPAKPAKSAKSAKADKNADKAKKPVAATKAGEPQKE